MVKFSKLVSKNFEKFSAFSFGELVGLTFLTDSCFSSFHCLSPLTLCQQTLENWVLFWVVSVLFVTQVSWSSFLYSGLCGTPKDHADHLLIQQIRLSVSSLICLALFTRSFRIYLNFFLPFWYNTLLVFFHLFCHLIKLFLQKRWYLLLGASAPVLTPAFATTFVTVLFHILCRLIISTSSIWPY